ncbi:MAG: glycosyl transferase family 2 [Solibacterales bacterium]|nr:glycosyl transferase family 2 [Bryobacterales bacterium]|tara:strand:+ start:11457 stop:12989 length:1533 start_codon:yes stop_codon:yes gene_type:complete
MLPTPGEIKVVLVVVTDWLTVTAPSAYQITYFEWVLLALYFTLMVILSILGFHRYQLIYLHRKHHDKVIHQPKHMFDQLPTVTVQLPIYNEPHVIENLLESISQIDYPRELLQIQVLDDSTDETSKIAIDTINRLETQGCPIEYRWRPNRQGYKAGALEAGLTWARGDLIAIFDADFSPSADFLHQTVHYFSDPSVGVVQTRWTYRNRDQSLLTRLQAILLDGHFVFEHGARSCSGRFFNFNGTAGVLRRSMIQDAGNWQHDTLTEDTDLSYRAQMRGWKHLYLPDVEVPSELPLDIASFQTQQARWAKGLTQTAKKTLPNLMRSNLPGKIKLEACFHLASNFSFPLMIILTLLLPLTVVIRHQSQSDYLFYYDLPIFLGTFSSLCSFYLLAQRELHPQDWKKNFLLMPWLPAIGISLTLTNARAVMEAIFNIPSPFERTTKLAGRSPTLPNSTGNPSLWLSAVHLAAGSYFTFFLGYSLLTGNWVSLPFLFLFALGYFFAGTLLLKSRK